MSKTFQGLLQHVCARQNTPPCAPDFSFVLVVCKVNKKESIYLHKIVHVQKC